jgi:hypothetical protein
MRICGEDRQGRSWKIWIDALLLFGPRILINKKNMV